MKRTTTDDFRTNLKDWMDEASKKPIKVTRKSGESFILVKSEEFERLQIELASLKGIAQGLSDVIHGRVHDSRENKMGEIFEKVKAKYSSKRGKPPSE